MRQCGNSVVIRGFPNAHWPGAGRPMIVPSRRGSSGAGERAGSWSGTPCLTWGNGASVRSMRPALIRVAKMAKSRAASATSSWRSSMPSRRRVGRSAWIARPAAIDNQDTARGGMVGLRWRLGNASAMRTGADDETPIGPRSCAGPDRMLWPWRRSTSGRGSSVSSFAWGGRYVRCLPRPTP